MLTKLLAYQPILLSPLFSRVLPTFSSRPPFLQTGLFLRRSPLLPLCVSKFSSRSSSEKMGGPGKGVSKSLIEDEAELSDWVSGLNSNSFKKKTSLYTDDDDVNDRNRDNTGEFRGGKRRRDSEFSGSRGGVGRASGRGRGGSKSFMGRGDNSDSGYNRVSGSGDFSNRRGGGNGDFSSRRGGGNGDFSNRRGGNVDFSNRRGGGRNGGSFSGRDRNDSSGEFGRGGKSGRMENRKSSESVFDRSQNRNYTIDSKGMGMKQGMARTGKRGIVATDDDDMEEDEDEGKGYSNFKGLIDSDESDEDDMDEEIEGGDDKSFENENVLSQSCPSSPGENASYLSETRFDQCSISPLTLKAVKDAGYEKMTLVQAATLPVILKGKDVMAKARTGTGKTVAFLLPAIEHIVKLPSAAHEAKRTPIYVLVICPTRELATQACAEANKLLKYHPSIGVQVVIGGTRLGLEQKRMQANPCQILVATPGRLRDHIENTAGFSTRLMGIRVLVLDEADHLLDMGFRKDIERIVAAVPKQRQTLLFSATIAEEVRQICHIALKRDHEYINTVQKGSEDTHAQVRQARLVAPLDKHFSLLYTMLKDHVADDVNYKILVFCTTAMVTRLVASLLGELKLNVREIHSRKPQSYRTRISDEFRKSKGLILVTSDVSARGVDYPDVTLVIQIGAPTDRQQYIHRLGRTGRKGKEGQGILLLAPWEEYFLSNIKDLPITKAPEISVDPDTRKKVERALYQVEMKNKEAAYQAWLGYYNSNKNVGRDKHRLVELANEFSRSMGLESPPAIPKLVLGKMGLKNVAGLRSK